MKNRVVEALCGGDKLRLAALNESGGRQDGSKAGGQGTVGELITGASLNGQVIRIRGLDRKD